MKTVAMILHDKGRQVACATGATSVRRAAAVMVEQNIGSLLVLNDDGTISGLVAERDLVHHLARCDDGGMEETVADVMCAPICVQESDTVAHCLQLMIEHRVRHLPVLEGHDLVGVVSIGDLVKAELADREFMIRQLQDYIHTPAVR